jgi:hypothetical protein
LSKSKEQMAAVIRRKHGEGDERRERADDARKHWVRQCNANDIVVNAARRAAAHGDDNAATEMLLNTRSDMARNRGPRAVQLERPSQLGTSLKQLGGPSDSVARCVVHTARPGLGSTAACTYGADPRYGRHDPETGELLVPDEYEVHTARYLGHAPAPPAVPDQDWTLSQQGKTPRTVAAAYATDREQRHGETFVLPALTVPKVRLNIARRR